MAADPTKTLAPESPTTARPLEMDDDDLQDANLNADDAAAGKPSASTGITLTSNDDAEPTDAAKKTAGSAGGDPGSTGGPGAEDAAPPPKPPRPMTEQQKKEQTLQEAFPTVEMPVIKAVLTASRGNIESAFHALLEMTDPEAIEREPTPPPPPPRPAHTDPLLAADAAASGRLSPNSQLVADEQLARELAQHYESEEGYEARTSAYGAGGEGGGVGGGYGARDRERRPYRRGPPRETGLKPNEMWDDDGKEHSFLDDDLPVIKENLRKGFVETQTKFNNWFTGIKKRIDEEWNAGNDSYDDHEDGGRPAGSPPLGPRPAQRPGGGGRGGFGAGAGAAAGGGRPQQPPRRSGDYDADPELLSDDFAGIRLHGDGTPMRQNQNPHLFRPPPSSTSPGPGSGHKVAFRDHDETIDVYGSSPKPPAKDGTVPERGGGVAAGAGSTPPPSSSSGGGGGAKASKWQPLSAVDPSPMADNDPFSLGDSEDEKDASHTKSGSTASASAGAPAAGSATAATGKDDGAPAKISTSSASPEDAERLRKAAAEAMADSLVEDKPKA